MYQSAFENVIFFGTADPRSLALMGAHYSAPQLSKETMCMMVSIPGRDIMIGTGTGFALSQRYHYNATGFMRPVSVLVPRFDGIMDGLGPLFGWWEFCNRTTLHMPGSWCTKMGRPRREPEHFRMIREGKVNRRNLGLGTSSIHMIVEKSRTTRRWSDLIAKQCVLKTSKFKGRSEKVLAFRIGDTLFAPFGRLIDGKHPSKPCLTLLKGIKHLVTNCSASNPNIPRLMVEGNTPEDVVSACKAAGCAPDIHLINRFPNDEEAYEMVRSLYKKEVEEAGVVSLASDTSIT